MIRRKFERVEPTGARTVSTRLIGGDENFCDRMYGYLLAKDGRLLPGEKPVLVTDNRYLFYYPITCYRNFPEMGFSLFANNHGDVHIIREENGGIDFEHISWEGESSGYFFEKDCDELNGRRGFYFVDGRRLFLVTSNGLWQRKNDMDSSVGVYHCGRLFVDDMTLGTTLRWSGETIYDWEERGVYGAGHLELPEGGGVIMGLFELGSDVIIVREYGLHVLHALGDPRHFRLEPLVRFGNDVYMKSTFAVKCGGKLWIASGKQVYCFSDGKLSELELQYTGTSGMVAANISQVGERYLYITFGFEMFVVKYDTLTGAYGVTGRGFSGVAATQSGVYAVVGSTICRLESGSGSNSRWESINVDVGISGIKKLKRLISKAKKPLTVEIYADNNLCSTVRLDGIADVGIYGKSFNFAVSGGDGIDSLTAEWEVSK